MNAETLLADHNISILHGDTGEELFDFEMREYAHTGPDEIFEDMLPRVYAVGFPHAISIEDTDESSGFDLPSNTFFLISTTTSAMAGLEPFKFEKEYTLVQ